MAVNNGSSRIVYSGNGSSAVFNYPGYFFATADLKVFTYNATTGSSRLEVLGTNYSVSGTPNAQGLYTNGANIVYNSSPGSTDKVILINDPPTDNDYNLGQNTAISSKALTQQLDYVALVEQRLRNLIDRCVKVPDSFSGNFDPTLPGNLAFSSGKRLIVGSGAVSFTFDEGFGSFIPNTLAVAVTNSSLVSLGGAAAGLILTSNGSSAPTWGAISIGSGSVSAGQISGILAPTNGGTGLTTPFNSPGVFYADTSTTYGFIAPAAAGLPLLANGSSAPAFGQVSLTVGVTGVLPLVNGGTGVAAATANAAFNALSPATTLGDLIYAGSGVIATRLGVGAAGQILTASSANGVAWANSPAGFTNPMSTSGDIIVGSGAGTAQRLGIGTGGQVLMTSASSSLGVQWATPFQNPLTTTGDVIVVGSGAVTTRLAAGPVNSYLKANGSSAPLTWAQVTSPGISTYASGATQSHTVSANRYLLKVHLLGGGGGGGGGGTGSPGNGGTGGTTSFGGVSATGGSGGVSPINGYAGALGGDPSGHNFGRKGATSTGNVGNSTVGTINGYGFAGAGAGGPGGANGGGAGQSAIAASGGGGGGAGGTASQQGAVGGGEGGYAEAYLTVTPGQVITYTVADGGVGGTAGTGGGAGGKGGSGAITVYEF